MTAMPAWKQSLLEKKRRNEEGEKRKLQSLNDLPSWKRELILKKRGSTELVSDREIVVNGEISHCSPVNNDNTVSLNSRRSSKGISTPRMAYDAVDHDPVGRGQLSPSSSVVINEGGVRNDCDDELSYQPGFVHKLLNKFSTITVKDSRDGGGKIKKTPSLESLVISDSMSDKSESSDSKTEHTKRTLPTKNKFRSMDNLLSAEEKRMEFSVSPRKLSESFGKEDNIIIIENLPAQKPVDTKTFDKKLVDKKPVNMKLEIETPKANESERMDDSEIISVSKIKSMFETNNRNTAGPKKYRAPKPPVTNSSVHKVPSNSNENVTDQKKLTSKSVSANSSSIKREPVPANRTNEQQSTTISTSSNHIPPNSRASEPISQRGSAIPKIVSSDSHSKPASFDKEDGGSPKLVSYKAIPDTTTKTSSGVKAAKSVEVVKNAEQKPGLSNGIDSSHVVNAAPARRTKPNTISVINKINNQVSAGTVYGAGDNKNVQISEAGLAGIRRAGKSWFFTTTSTDAPSGCIPVKMRLRKPPARSIAKRTKTAVNNHRKEVNRNSMIAKPNENMTRTPSSTSQQVASVSRKRHAPPPPKHVAVLRIGQEMNGIPVSNIDDVSMGQPLKSSISKGSGKKFRIQFNDDANMVHEYPSEKVLIQHLPREPDCTYADDVPHVIMTNEPVEDEEDGEPEQKSNILTSTPAIGATGSLSSYQSKFQMDYQFGKSMKEETPLIPTRPDDKMEEEEDIEITYADDYETSAWSSSANSDMLF